VDGGWLLPAAIWDVVVADLSRVVLGRSGGREEEEDLLHERNCGLCRWYRASRIDHGARFQQTVECDSTKQVLSGPVIEVSECSVRTD
jgi:hypothetical protein